MGLGRVAAVHNRVKGTSQTSMERDASGFADVKKWYDSQESKHKKEIYND